jgi:hypothetical protein
MSITAKNVKDDFPDLRVHLVINSELKEQIDKDSFFYQIETISKKEMNEFILASSLENPALSTTLTHIFTMKAKNVKTEILEIAEAD